MTETVPFGKYKGRPVEEMLADAEYMAWLEAQPWFRERFLHLLSRRDAEAASRTPVHNRMQALFLSEPYRWAFFSVAAPARWFEIRAFPDVTLRDHQADLRERAAMLRARASSERAGVEYNRNFDPDEIPSDWLTQQTMKRAAEANAEASDLEQKAESTDRLARRYAAPVSFEHRGADVRLQFSATQEKWCRPGAYNTGSDRAKAEAVESLAVEIKPTVSDEYPAVLRQMQRNQSEYLFVGAYQGEGVTEAQFVAIFAASGKTVVFKRDVDARMAECSA